MTFDDRISSWDRLPDLAPLRAQYALLCAQLLAAILHPSAALALAGQLRRHVHVMVQAAQIHFRARQKTEMLLRPHRRERVICELGGWKRLRRWTRRQAEIDAAPPEKNYERVFHPAADAEKRARRIRMRELMRANTHPLILRDPCRMDFDGWFRLPPQVRLVNPIADPDYDYDFDPRPMGDFRGIKTPITVWPQEFRAAAEIRPLEEESEEAVFRDSAEADASKRREVRRQLVFHEVPKPAPLPAPEPVFLEKQILFFFVRAPPRRRGAPNPTCRQESLLAACFRMGVINSALNKYG